MRSSIPAKRLGGLCVSLSCMPAGHDGDELEHMACKRQMTLTCATGRPTWPACNRIRGKGSCSSEAALLSPEHDQNKTTRPRPESARCSRRFRETPTRESRRRNQAALLQRFYPHPARSRALPPWPDSCLWATLANRRPAGQVGESGARQLHLLVADSLIGRPHDNPRPGPAPAPAQPSEHIWSPSCAPPDPPRVSVARQFNLASRWQPIA